MDSSEGYLFWILASFSAVEFYVSTFETTFLPLYMESCQLISRSISTSSLMMEADRMSEMLIPNLHYAYRLRGFY
jgi:hypothetical protein